MKHYECLDCNGNGQVEGWIAGELEEIWDCPECNGTGQISRIEYFKQEDSHQALQNELSKEEFKY